MLPRRAEMELIRVFMQYGGTMFDYQSAMIGGKISGLVPNPPTVIL
jgi:predicted Abi (CAAX) family protease